jgi:hypothetical protein
MAHFIEESDLAGNTLSTDLPVVALQRLNNYMSYMCSFKPENDTQLEADIEGTALQVPSEDDEVDANEPVLNELHVSNAVLNELEQVRPLLWWYYVLILVIRFVCSNTSRMWVNFKKF